MQKILAIIFGLFLTFAVYGQADTTGFEGVKLSSRDSAYVVLQDNHLAKVLGVYNLGPQRYKIYKTENLYNLIKLDTATGRLWQLQYRMGEVASEVVAIDDNSLLWSWEDEVPGRYELYPTNNTYTFILLDTKYGYTYQVQWNTKGPNYRFRERIY